MKKIDCFTITEVMVALILNGIVFICAIDAFSSFRTYYSKNTSFAENSANVIIQKENLISVITNSDSIRDVQQGWVRWNMTNPSFLIHENDSLILLSTGIISDTLLRYAQKFTPVMSRSENIRCFLLELKYKNLTYNYTIPVVEPSQRMVIDSMVIKENKYR